MSEPPDLMVVMTSADGMSVAIRLPVRPDGALPYLLTEVTDEVKSMYDAALRSQTEHAPIWDDELPADTDET